MIIIAIAKIFILLLTLFIILVAAIAVVLELIVPNKPIVSFYIAGWLVIASWVGLVAIWG